MEEVIGINRFEDIEAWQLARKLTRKVYDLTKKIEFARDFGLKRQIQDAAGSSMHYITLILINRKREKAFDKLRLTSVILSLRRELSRTLVEA